MSTKEEFAGKVALITGGTSGIGLETARLFLERGASALLMGRNRARGERAVGELTEFGDRIEFYAGDVASLTDCTSAVNFCLRRFGSLDILVNSAGIYKAAAIANVTTEDFDEVFAVNVKGTYFMCQTVSVFMQRQKSGAIINVSSDAGIKGNYFCTLYGASKGAVNALTKSLALELAPYVRVNAVCPGDIATPMTERQMAETGETEAELAALYPLKRIGKAREAAEAIAFLASERASFVTGALLSVDGGITA